jgi:hypothetical protein
MSCASWLVSLWTVGIILCHFMSLLLETYFRCDSGTSLGASLNPGGL